MAQLLTYAFILGLAGSFHCIGMCGAIALSLPIKSLPSAQQNIGIILYNLGRLLSYSVIGFLFGFIGRTFYLGGFQQWISVITGLIMVLYFVSTYLLKRNFELVFMHKSNTRIQKVLTKYIKKQDVKNVGLIGILNGFLPCGMVYFALASALATSSLLNGTLFMLFFGLGTVPMMILVSYLGVFISLSVRNGFKKIMPFFMLTIGILFILRGLNLNIPYISPLIENINGKIIPCH